MFFQPNSQTGDILASHELTRAHGRALARALRHYFLELLVIVLIFINFINKMTIVSRGQAPHTPHLKYYASYTFLLN